MGELIFRFQGTLERFTGDGLMVFFNDPLPCDDPAGKAVAMAVDMRSRVRELATGWSARGHDLGFSIGIAQGFATLGRIGFEGRFDYAAIGSVTNLASRLCAKAPAWHVLVTQRVQTSIAEQVVTEAFGDLELHGFSRPVRAFTVRGLDAARVTP
jgi:class 3 adenylate cyclase